MLSAIKSFLGNRKGASAVEFAIIAPFLLLLVSAIIAYGSLFATSLSLQQLGAEAARATIGGLTDTERENLAQVRINELASSYPLLRADRLSFEFNDSAGNSAVRLSYVTTDHPAYVLKGLIPLPPSPLVYSMAVTDGDGVGS
jgi:Flp pilus assembly protein TadG